MCRVLSRPIRDSKLVLLRLIPKRRRSIYTVKTCYMQEVFKGLFLLQRLGCAVRNTSIGALAAC